MNKEKIEEWERKNGDMKEAEKKGGLWKKEDNYDA